MPLTDAEVIATWMEPKPLDLDDKALYVSKWWTSGVTPSVSGWIWAPIDLTLDRLNLVEARLTDEQWWAYESNLCPRNCSLLEAVKGLINATAEQKIVALAQLLRREIEK